MKAYKEEEFLMLSGLQHYVFCKRQWALIHLEQQWVENYLTTDGDIMHQKAHDGMSFEKRKDVLISRGMPVKSYELGISGECDIVEFKASKEGINIFGREGKYQIYPVEYKRGKPKEDGSDTMQVVAQALCLEEMFCCSINQAYLYYGETKKRQVLYLNDEVKERARLLIKEMHELYQRRHTPKVKPSKACKSCSLVDICLPKITCKKSASVYIDQIVGEE